MVRSWVECAFVRDNPCCRSFFIVGCGNDVFLDLRHRAFAPKACRLIGVNVHFSPFSFAAQSGQSRRLLTNSIPSSHCQPFVRTDCRQAAESQYIAAPTQPHPSQRAMQLLTNSIPTPRPLSLLLCMLSVALTALPRYHLLVGREDREMAVRSVRTIHAAVESSIICASRVFVRGRYVHGNILSFRSFSLRSYSAIAASAASWRVQPHEASNLQRDGLI